MRIQPVFIWGRAPSEFLVVPGFSILDGLRSRGQDELDVALSRIKVAGILPLQILSGVFISIRGETRELVRYAKEQSAELIVVSSHARRGAKRFLLGSFAETLIFYADVPIFIVHPSRSSKFTSPATSMRRRSQ